MSPDLARAWSQCADEYEEHFIDPYAPDVHNPLWRVLERIPSKMQKTVGDLGCGTGPLLPYLAAQFGQVIAVDFAEGMLQRARERCRDISNVQFHCLRLQDLGPLHGQLDVAVAINSLGLPNPADIDRALRQIYQCLRPGGWFMGIVPAMDAIHYLTMLLVDRALQRGLPLDAARKNAAHHASHDEYDFAFSQFSYRGTEQHFWFGFEVPYRLRRAGFVRIRWSKVYIPWPQVIKLKDLARFPPSWDWFFLARRPPTLKRSLRS
ncbi:MAG: class I SAM-dependent methyltransferase [Gemmatales bacterium]|nr:methyltransferase domain-containing protein [Gemmatales bacterium]MDW7993678.1 class I SAM-dependent methyltransferase [Gemmatales bacterium]